MPTYQELKDDGSTSCGSWIHAGIYADGVNQTARKKPGSEQNWIAPEWGWAWPTNRRILYNRASADPDGNPWSERKRYVWWDGEEKKWASLGDDPDFEPDKPPDYRAAEGRDGAGRDRRHRPVHHPPRRAGLALGASGLVDGPLPAHYEPHESPVANALYAQQREPHAPGLRAPGQPLQPDAGSGRSSRSCMTTYRLTEHHTAGGMSRTVRYLSELQPEMFCEVSPAAGGAARARARRLGDDRRPPRAAIEARVLVTERMQAAARAWTATSHQVGLPYHWGRTGLVTGDAGERAAAARARPQRAHLGVQGRHLRHPARPAAARPGAARLVAEYRRRAG